jgi:hypothetical protein
LVLGLSALPAGAHREHNIGQLLHNVSLAEARQLAEAEFKIVLVYVVGPDDEVPAYLRRPTWEDWRTLELLLWETVAITLHSVRDAEALRPYKPRQLPAILLLDANGTERRQLPGDLSAEQLAQQLTADLSAADAVERARRGLEAAGGKDPFARERLAGALLRRGDLAAALDEYRLCVEEGLRQNVRYASAQRRLLFEQLTVLAQRYAPARQALRAWQASMENTLRNERDDANLARDLATLNRCLGDEPRTLALFDASPQRSRTRHILFDQLLERLVSDGRYEDVLARIEPLQAFEQDVVFVRMRGGMLVDAPDAREIRGTCAHAVHRGAALLEAAAATGRLDAARELATRILEFHNSPETRTLLENRAQRVGCDPLVQHIRSHGAAAPAGDTP